MNLLYILRASNCRSKNQICERGHLKMISSISLILCTFITLKNRFAQ